MASGYDKSPPEPEYEPEFPSGIKLVVVGIFAILLISSFGWLFL